MKFEDEKSGEELVDLTTPVKCNDGVELVDLISPVKYNDLRTEEIGAAAITTQERVEINVDIRRGPVDEVLSSKQDESKTQGLPNSEWNRVPK